MEKPTPQLGPGKENLAPFEYHSNKHDAKIPSGVTPAEVLVPAFWAHQAVNLRPRDEIRAWSEDGSWILYLIVVDSARNWAKVHVRSTEILGDKAASIAQVASQEYQDMIRSIEIKWRGAAKWSVIRLSDKSVLHEGEETKEGALAWRDRHIRVELGAPKKLATAVA